MPGPITRRQKDVLDYIKLYTHERGHSPTHREIMRGIGSRSVGNIHRMLCALEEAGHIRTNPRRRGIELLGPNPSEQQTLRDIRNAADVFINNQLKFREEHTVDPNSDKTKDLSRRVQNSFGHMLQLVKGDPR